MATFTKVGKRTRAQIRLPNHPSESQTFNTLREAKAWAMRRELELRTVAGRSPLKYSLGQAIDRYIADIAPKHKGGEFEIKRLRAVSKTLPLARPLAKFDDVFWENWRDQRLKTTKRNDPTKTLSTGTVRREMCDLALVFKYAVKLKWITDNPFKNVERPPHGKARKIIITPEQIEAMFQSLNYTRGVRPSTSKQTVGAMFDLALETGLRSSEIVNLDWPRVFFDKDYIHLDDTKNGDSRDVPMSPTTKIILKSMIGFSPDKVFDINHNNRDTIFRKARKSANLSGFTFHDARHTAATNIAAQMRHSDMPPIQAVFEFCGMFGWRDIDEALTYFKPKASEVAKWLS